MFIPKEQPAPTDPAVIDQLKSLSKKLDDLTKQNDLLSMKTTALEVRLRARSVSCASSFSDGTSSAPLSCETDAGTKLMLEP